MFFFFGYCLPLAYLTFELISALFNIRQWYWQLVYFVHYKSQLISSRSHTSIQTSKLDFLWTNVYNGTYTLALTSGGLGWRFSKSFYLWTEEHLTVSAEARDKIGWALLQAWFKMNVRSG